MIYPDVDPVKWAKKYGLEIIRENCRNCGKEVVVNIPCISKQFVGFDSQPHECGEQYRIMIVKPRFSPFED